MTAPPVSVIMPVYNAAQYLDAAIWSIRNQTFSRFELVIIDDGSTDGSREVLDRHARDDDRITVYNLNHQGTSNVMNFGIAQAKGQYIAIMHADDTAMPSRLEKQVHFLEVNRSVAVIGSACDVIDNQGQYITTFQNPLNPSICRDTLKNHHNCVCNHSAMVRKSAFERAGQYHQLLWPAEDYDIWLRISEFSEIANLPDALVTYRFHFENVSTRRTYQQALAVAAVQEAAHRRQALAFLKQHGVVGDNRFLNKVTELTWEVLKGEGVSDSKIFMSLASLYSTYLGVAVSCRRYDVIARLFHEVASIANARAGRQLFVRVLHCLLVKLVSHRCYLQVCKYIWLGVWKGRKRDFISGLSRAAVELVASAHPLNVRARSRNQNALSDARIDFSELTVDPETKSSVLMIIGWSPKLLPYRSQTITICGLPAIIKMHVSRLPYFESAEKTGLLFRGFSIACHLSAIPKGFDKDQICILIDKEHLSD